MLQGILVTTRAVLRCKLVTLVRVEDARLSIDHALDCIRVAFVEDHDRPCTTPEWRSLTVQEKLLVIGNLEPAAEEQPQPLLEEVSSVE